MKLIIAGSRTVARRPNLLLKKYQLNPFLASEDLDKYNKQLAEVYVHIDNLLPVNVVDGDFNHVLPSEVVSGTAEGADLAGESWAMDRGVKIKRFKPDWFNLGKRAGYERNKQMAEYSDEAIVFIENNSKGSEMMVREMKKLGKPVKVVRL